MFFANFLQDWRSLTLQLLHFWTKKGRGTPPKARGFLFAEPLNSLEKKGKTPPKSKENRKTQKARKSRKKSKDWRVRDFKREWNLQSRMESSSELHSKGPLPNGGEFSRSRLKFSSENDFFKWECEEQKLVLRPRWPATEQISGLRPKIGKTLEKYRKRPPPENRKK